MVIYREKEDFDSDVSEGFYGEPTLEYDFVPDFMEFRDKEIRSISKNFRSLFTKNDISTVIAVLGGPGYGKTSFVRFTVR